MHPLDLVKTRFQLQQGKASFNGGNQHYTSVADCMKKMYKSEGLLSFWKGILPPILVETPKRAWKVGQYELYNDHFLTFSFSFSRLNSLRVSLK